MKLRTNGWYTADKGKHFVLTEKGKEEVASYKNLTVGEPVSEYDTEAVGWSVENGYEIEVDIPNWIVKTGYAVMYEHNGYMLHAGNPIVFPEFEIADKYLNNYEKNHNHLSEKLVLKVATYEGKALVDRRIHEGKPVFNRDWYYGPDALYIGDLIEEDIVDDVINCLPPVCMRSDCVQLGEATSQRYDENGRVRTTYVTFKKIADKTWEYCGDCFPGENEQRGKDISVHVLNAGGVA